MNKWLALICSFTFILICIFEKIDYWSHNIEIDNIFINDISKNEHSYVGFIEIQSLKIKREIVLGVNEKNLSQHVTMYENNQKFNGENIILAGHSVKNIFGNLHKINVQDTISIYLVDKMFNYIVISKEIVEYKKIEVIDDSDLILITCTYDNKRLIVKAKKI